VVAVVNLMVAFIPKIGMKATIRPFYGVMATIRRQRPWRTRGLDD